APDDRDRGRGDPVVPGRHAVVRADFGPVPSDRQRRPAAHGPWGGCGGHRRALAGKVRRRLRREMVGMYPNPPVRGPCPAAAGHRDGGRDHCSNLRRQWAHGILEVTHTRDPPRAAGKEIMSDIDVIVTAKYTYLVEAPDEIVEAAESDNPAVREAGREQLAAWADPDLDPVIMSDVVVLDYDADLLLPGQAHDPVNQSLQDAID